MSELKIIAVIVFIGIFAYQIKSSETKPKNLGQFIWHLIVTAIVAAVFTLPMIGALSGLLFGWTGN